MKTTMMVAGLCAACAVTSAAHAVQVKITYGGVVDTVDTAFGPLPAALSNVQVGDRWTYEFTLDTDTVVSAPAQPGAVSGLWQDHFGGLVGPATLTIGGASDTGTTERFRGHDDFQSSPFNPAADGYTSSAIDQGYTFGGATTDVELTVGAWFSDLSSISSPDVPTSPMLLSPADRGVMFLDFYPGGGFSSVGVDGYTTYFQVEVVPAPGAAGLMAVGGLVASRRRRR